MLAGKVKHDISYKELIIIINQCFLKSIYYLQKDEKKGACENVVKQTNKNNIFVVQPVILAGEIKPFC